MSSIYMEFPPPPPPAQAQTNLQVLSLLYLCVAVCIINANNICKNMIFIVILYLVIMLA